MLELSWDISEEKSIQNTVINERPQGLDEDSENQLKIPLKIQKQSDEDSQSGSSKPR